MAINQGLIYKILKTASDSRLRQEGYEAITRLDEILSGNKDFKMTSDVYVDWFFRLKIIEILVYGVGSEKYTKEFNCDYAKIVDDLGIEQPNSDADDVVLDTNDPKLDFYKKIGWLKSSNNKIEYGLDQLGNDINSIDKKIGQFNSTLSSKIKSLKNQFGVRISSYDDDELIEEDIELADEDEVDVNFDDEFISGSGVSSAGGDLDDSVSDRAEFFNSIELIYENSILKLRKLPTDGLRSHKLTAVNGLNGIIDEFNNQTLISSHVCRFYQNDPNSRKNFSTFFRSITVNIRKAIELKMSVNSEQNKSYRIVKKVNIQTLNGWLNPRSNTISNIVAGTCRRICLKTALSTDDVFSQVAFGIRIEPKVELKPTKGEYSFSYTEQPLRISAPESMAKNLLNSMNLTSEAGTDERKKEIIYDLDNNITTSITRVAREAAKAGFRILIDYINKSKEIALLNQRINTIDGSQGSEIIESIQGSRKSIDEADSLINILEMSDDIHDGPTRDFVDNIKNFVQILVGENFTEGGFSESIQHIFNGGGIDYESMMEFAISVYHLSKRTKKKSFIKVMSDYVNGNNFNESVIELVGRVDNRTINAMREVFGNNSNLSNLQICLVNIFNFHGRVNIGQRDIVSAQENMANKFFKKEYPVYTDETETIGGYEFKSKLHALHVPAGINFTFLLEKILEYIKEDGGVDPESFNPVYRTKSIYGTAGVPLGKLIDLFKINGKFTSESLNIMKGYIFSFVNYLKYVKAGGNNIRPGGSNILNFREKSEIEELSKIGSEAGWFAVKMDGADISGFERKKVPRIEKEIFYPDFMEVIHPENNEIKEKDVKEIARFIGSLGEIDKKFHKERVELDPTHSVISDNEHESRYNQRERVEIAEKFKGMVLPTKLDKELWDKLETLNNIEIARLSIIKTQLRIAFSSIFGFNRNLHDFGAFKATKIISDNQITDFGKFVLFIHYLIKDSTKYRELIGFNGIGNLTKDFIKKLHDDDEVSDNVSLITLRGFGAEIESLYENCYSSSYARKMENALLGVKADELAKKAFSEIKIIFGVNLGKHGTTNLFDEYANTVGPLGKLINLLVNILGGYSPSSLGDADREYLVKRMKKLELCKLIIKHAGTLNKVNPGGYISMDTDSPRVINFKLGTMVSEFNKKRGEIKATLSLNDGKIEIEDVPSYNDGFASLFRSLEDIIDSCMPGGNFEMRDICAFAVNSESGVSRWSRICGLYKELFDRKEEIGTILRRALIKSEDNRVTYSKEVYDFIKNNILKDIPAETTLSAEDIIAYAGANAKRASFLKKNNAGCSEYNVIHRVLMRYRKN